jgi:Predicted transcriptional regulator with C-terminal CBS domains
MINETIKLRRVEQKLTQQELSERSGVSQQLISKIENGKAQPSAADNYKTCRCFVARY